MGFYEHLGIGSNKLKFRVHVSKYSSVVNMLIGTVLALQFLNISVLGLLQKAPALHSFMQDTRPYANKLL